MSQHIGRAAPFVQSENPNDIVVKVRDRHYRIRESDARRLIRGQRDADLYSGGLRSWTGAGRQANDS